MGNLIVDILKNEKSVREIIDEHTNITEADVSIDPADLEDAPEQDTNAPAILANVTDDAEFRHLFVRRWKEGDDKPYKRSKVPSAAEAIRLYFQWLNQYKKDKVEIWSDVALDAKNFYRFVLKNRDQIEPIWKNSIRAKKAMPWNSAYREAQARGRQSGANVTGTLEPFSADAQ